MLFRSVPLSSVIISATDMIRILEPQEWQVLSTPKRLTGDADMMTLLSGTPYTEILTYKEGAWVQVLPTEELEPLYAYLLNMRQNYCAPDECSPEICVGQKNVYAKYVFARAVDPAYAMPEQRLLTKGANLIAPAFNEEEVSPWMLIAGALTMEQDGDQYLKDVDCFEYDGGCCDNPVCPDCAIPTYSRDEICPDLLFQADSLAHLTATFCSGCTMIANYGGDSAGECRNKAGNLAWFTSAALGGNNVESWLADPLNFAFNGDGYLAYLTQSQTMTGSAQLELVNVFNEAIY